MSNAQVPSSNLHFDWGLRWYYFFKWTGWPNFKNIIKGIKIARLEYHWSLAEKGLNPISFSQNWLSVMQSCFLYFTVVGNVAFAAKLSVLELQLCTLQIMWLSKPVPLLLTAPHAFNIKMTINETWELLFPPDDFIHARYVAQCSEQNMQSKLSWFI